MFLTDFEAYLKTACGRNANTTAKFMQSLKRIVLIARNNGWMHYDPFANYPIRISQVDRGHLTEDEIKAIMSKLFITPKLEQVRDVFIFSCFFYKVGNETAFRSDLQTHRQGFQTSGCKHFSDTGHIP